MWYMGHIRHGTGMYTTTACMHIFSLHTATACGGTGAGRQASMVRVGDLVSDGTHHGILLGIHLGITADGILLGTQVIGAVTGVATGDRDGITIIHIMDGTADGIAQDIPITDRVDICLEQEVPQLLQDHRIPDVHSHRLP